MSPGAQGREGRRTRKQRVMWPEGTPRLRQRGQRGRSLMSHGVMEQEPGEATTNSGQRRQSRGKAKPGTTRDLKREALVGMR